MDGDGVWLGFAGGAAAGRNVFLKELSEAGDDFGVLGVVVGGFGGVGGEIVELDGGKVGGLRGAGAGFAPAAGIRAEFELPPGLADGEGAVDGVVDDGFAEGSCGGAEEGGEEADAVLGGIGGEFGAEDVGGGGHEVGEAEELVGRGAGLHAGGPADQERDAVTAVENVGFVAAEKVGGVVTFGEEAGEIGLRRAAVVAGDDDEGIVGEALFFEFVQQLADGVVGLHDEVGVVIEAAFALPFLGGNDGGVGGGEGEIEEEGFAGPRVSGAGFDVVDGFGGEGGQDIFDFEIGGGGTAAAFALGAAEEHGEILFDGREFGDAVVLDEGVGDHVEGGADAEVVVEADGVGAVGNGLGVVHVVDLGGAFDAEFGDGLAVLFGPVHAEVPLADARGVITVLLEEGGDGEAVGFDEAGADAAKDAALEAGAPVVTAGHDAVAGGGADGGTGVNVGKYHAAGGEAVEAGGGDSALGVEALDVAVAKIVAEDVEEVGFGGGRGTGRGVRQREREQKEKDTHGAGE